MTLSERRARQLARIRLGVKADPLAWQGGETVQFILEELDAVTAERDNLASDSERLKLLAERYGARSTVELLLAERDALQREVIALKAEVGFLKTYLPEAPRAPRTE